MRVLGVLLLAVGCASVEAASPLPVVQPALPDQSVSDTRDEPEPPSVTASLPPPRTCRDALDRAGVRYREAAPAPHVEDFLRVEPILGGISFRHHLDERPRALWLDCRLAERLVAATDLFRARGIREVIHVGTYEPKCVGGGTPDSRPDCTLSPHALGMAIDIAGFVRENDTVEIGRDFVRRDGPIPTCLSPRGDERDAFLKELVCALDGTFSVLLTPNYDRHHKAHFHLALHPPSKTPWSNGVDPVRAAH